MAATSQKRALIAVDQSDRSLRLIATLNRKNRCAVAARIDPTTELELLSARVLSRLLAEDGFEVDIVVGARAAARHLVRQRPLSALLIDVARPGPWPMALAHHARSVHPRLPILFITTDKEMLGGATFEPPYAVLEKPIDYGSLAEILEGFAELQRYATASLDSSAEAATQP